MEILLPYVLQFYYSRGKLVPATRGWSMKTPLETLLGMDPDAPELYCKIRYIQILSTSFRILQFCSPPSRHEPRTP
eukprot:1176559-Prorocentrum_minimum.AAC.6